MTTLLVAKQYIKKFVIKYEVYLKPLFKLALSLITLMMINAKIGYNQTIESIPIVLIVSLMCSFLPMNFIIFVAASFIIMHLYAISLECAIIMLVVFVILFLLYFRFSPKDTIVVLLVPVCFALKIPYVIPLAMGLMGTPASAISVGSGVIVSSLLEYISQSATALSAMDTEDMTSRIRFLIDGFVGNKSMMLTVIAFSITVVLVYFIRRLSIEHAWTIAIVAGALANVTILLVGDLIFDTNVSILGLIIGTTISVLGAKIVEFFAFHVDYNRVEKVQFEDDEYYYYVKAVPKITMTAPSKTVKKINLPRRQS